MNDPLKEVASAVVCFLLGSMVASLAWSRMIPDEPKQTCVPLYNETGLECCQPINPEN